MLLDFADHLPSSQVHLTQRFIEIVDDQIEHELMIRWRKIIGIGGKGAPHCENNFPFGFRSAPQWGPCPPVTPSPRITRQQHLWLASVDETRSRPTTIFAFLSL